MNINEIVQSGYSTCVDCDSPATVALFDCCDNYHGTHLCVDCVDNNTSPICNTEIESL